MQVADASRPKPLGNRGIRRGKGESAGQRIEAQWVANAKGSYSDTPAEDGSIALSLHQVWRLCAYGQRF